MQHLDQASIERGIGVRDPIMDYPQIGLVIGGIFFVYVTTFFLQIGSRIDFLGSIRFEFLLAVILLVLALSKNSSYRYPSCPITGLLFLFIFLVAIQVPFSVNASHSTLIFVDRFLKFSAMALFIAVFAANPMGLKIFVVAFMLSCFKMGQEGLIGHITGSMIWENQGVMRLHGSTRLYAHPNSFAGMALGTLPFIYYLFPLVNKYVKAILLVMVVFAGNIIVFSGSRTAYVGFFAFVYYIFRKSAYKKKFILAAVFVSIVAIPVIPDSYKERFQSIFTGEDKEGHSSDARMLILEDSLTIFAEHPLGVGVSGFPTARMNRFGRKQDTHNLYMEIATNLGIQGLIAFLVLIVVVLREFGRLDRSFANQKATILAHCKDDRNRGSPEIVGHLKDIRFFQAMTRAAAAYLFMRLALGLFGHDLYEIYWWVTFGLLYALFRCNVVAVNRTREVLKTQAVSTEMSN